MTTVVTVMWVAVEVLDEQAVEPAAVRSAFDQVTGVGGGRAFDPPGAVFAAAFDDPAAAVEASIVGQWNVQRLERHPGVKVRVGLHVEGGQDGAAMGAAALSEVANGNQILFSGSVDAATNGLLDARPMGVVELEGMSAPTQVWMVTDSRPDVDGRPLRLPSSD
jgi:class 3 adenylate cyclase